MCGDHDGGRSGPARAVHHLIGVLCFVIASCPALAADTKKEPTDAQKAQQQRMKDCNDKARDKKGDERKVFMKSCLAGKDAPATTAKSAQQERMTKCNKDPNAKRLKGDERKAFMSSCLRG